MHFFANLNTAHSFNWQFAGVKREFTSSINTLSNCAEGLNR